MSSSSSPVVVKRKRIRGDDDEGHGRKKVRGSFRTFEDARAYVRTLGLKSWKEWEAWSKSGKRQHDMPSHPQRTYASSGWTSYGDFLGYAEGKVAGSFRSFEDARAYVRTLGLKSAKEWETWRSSGVRTHDIPSTPEKTYASSGWTSYGDFLGYAEGQGVRGSFRSFEVARKYVRTLGLNSAKEWWAWSSSGARPHDIPSAPQTTYKGSGWTSYGDFLGYADGQGARGWFRTFEDARKYVRTLGLKSCKEWETWSKSGARPHDIPGQPYATYASSGWTSYGDFLGYADGQGARGSFRSFEDARTYVRTLGLKSEKEWKAWSASGARPDNIPSNPQTTYTSAGWTSYGDFLGYAEGPGSRGSFRTFEDARTYVRTLGLKSYREWKAWSKSGKRPHDIPANPNVTYASTGWTSYGDFLGYAEGQGARGSFRTFEDARKYVRTLGLNSAKEWWAWSSSGARPHDIPSAPQTTYKGSGWTSMGDFLGYADGQGANASLGEMTSSADFASESAAAKAAAASAAGEDTEQQAAAAVDVDVAAAAPPTSARDTDVDDADGSAVQADECGVCFEALSLNGDGRRALFFPCLHAKQCLSCAMRVWESASPTGDVTCPWCSAVLNAPPVAIWT
ncbi:methyltransferase domain-containing protein [Pycnococcus provasolii]